MHFNQNKILLIIYICGLFASAALAQSDNQMATLHIISPVKGCCVELDGRMIGLTPLYGITTDPGRHIIKVWPGDSLSWLARSWSNQIDLKAGLAHTIYANTAISFWLSSDPPGVSVWSENVLLGLTPLSISREDVKTDLRLVRSGYRDNFIDILSSKQIFLHKRMSPLDFYEKSLRPSRLDSRKLLLGGAVSVILGAAGYWLKIRAESEYDAYMSTGHPDKMKRHFNNAKKYDQWSGALYIAGEAALGITIYFSVRELWR